MTGRVIGPVAAICLLLASAIWLQIVRERHFGVQPDEASTVLPPPAVDRLAFAHRPLIADLYWIRAIQYFGGQRRRIEANAWMADAVPAAQRTVGFELLYPMLDIATTLDPLFTIAYRFGAIFLSAPHPNGAGQPDKAVALLEKGHRARPDKWEYLHDIGFVYYWDVHDYIKAAEYLNRAADVPGAPWWLRSMAATTLAKGGQRSTSRMLWQQMYENSQDETARRAAVMKLEQLNALEFIEQLQAKVDSYAARSKSPQFSWPALVAAGIVPGVPHDSHGTPYEISESGRVGLSPRSPLFPLPLEPAPQKASQ
jgi:hypothetical protein